MAEGAHAYLLGIEKQCDQIHIAIAQSYLSYPIEHALPA